MAAKPFNLPPPSSVPLVDRDKEREPLTKALADAKVARGLTWLVEGAAGIGKTRLVRWLEEEAVKKGFRVSWGYCLKESNLPFFPFQQIFRHAGPVVAAPTTSLSGADEELPLLTIFESERPLRLLERVAALSSSHPCLVVSRERPDHLRKQFPSLAPDARVLQLTKGGEGEDCLPPGEVDAIGERLSQHLKSGEGALVAVTNLDYLVSQNGFPPVLRLVQFLREEAERADAHVLFSVNPATLEKREMALLEGEGDVVREAAPQPAAVASSEPEPPAITMLRYLETLEREAPQQPRLLVIDDVQWADPDSLRTLQFLARNIRSLPVLLVGTIRGKEWRTSEDKANPVLDDILEKIDEEGSLFRLQLDGLGERESQDLVERTIGLPLQRGDGTSDNTLLSIFRRAEGNPYFVQETMRQLAQEGLLRKEGDHAVLVYRSTGQGTSAGEAPPIPPTLRRLVARRLSMLAKDEMELLRWASVVGSEFDLPPLVAALNRPVAEVSALLHRLDRDFHIIDAQPGGERWSFGHPLVWEVTLSETEPGERRRKALKLADWWAEHRADDVGTVARLYHDAEEPVRGLPWVRKALEQVISQRAPETAERYFHWLQDLLHMAGVEPSERLREGISFCERHELEMGGGQTLCNMLEFLTNLPVSLEERLPVRIFLAGILALSDVRKGQAQMDIVNNEMALMRGKLPLKWAVRRELVNIDILDRQGKVKAALEVSERLSKVIGEVQEPSLKGHAAYLRGYSYAAAGQIVGAKGALKELRDLSRTSNSVLVEMLCPALEVVVAEVDGDFKQAEESAGQVLSSCKRQGDLRNAAVALANLVLFSARRGRFDAAREYLQEGLKLCSRFGYRDMTDALPMLEAHILWSEQKWPEHVSKLKSALSKVVGNQTGRIHAYAALAEGHLGAGDIPSARACINKAVALRDELAPEDFADVLRVRARVEEAEGDAGAAKKTLEEALHILEEHPCTFWSAWSNAEMARWEYNHGDPTLAATFRAKADSLFDKSGVLPEAKSKWMQDIRPKTG